MRTMPSLLVHYTKAFNAVARQPAKLRSCCSFHLGSAESVCPPAQADSALQDAHNVAEAPDIPSTAKTCTDERKDNLQTAFANSRQAHHAGRNVFLAVQRPTAAGEVEAWLAHAARRCTRRSGRVYLGKARGLRGGRCSRFTK